MSLTQNIFDVFFGVPQSRYAAVAVIFSVIIAAIVIIYDNNTPTSTSKPSLTLTNKIQYVFIVFLMGLPSVALAFLQLTCIVTGANNNKWWCNAYAWLLCIFIVFYALCIIIAAIFSIRKKDNFVDGAGPVGPAPSEQDIVNSVLESKNQLTFADILNNSR